MFTDGRLEKIRQKNTPPGGWKENTYYLVEVSYQASNPVHLAILGVDWLDKYRENYPCHYSQIWNTTYDRPIPFENAYYLKVLRELVTFDEG